jgi:hypothetical protein
VGDLAGNLVDSARGIGGVAALFPLLSSSSTPEQLHLSALLLALFLDRNSKNLLQMARLRGYEMLAHVLAGRQPPANAPLAAAAVSASTSRFGELPPFLLTDLMVAWLFAAILPRRAARPQ